MSARCPAPVRLADYSRGRLEETERDRLARHVAGCDGCRTSLARVRAARHALDAVAEEAPRQMTPASAARVEATLRWSTGQGGQPTSRGRAWWAAWRRPLLGGGLALASVAVAATVGGRLASPRRRSVEAPHVTLTPPSTAPAPKRLLPSVRAVVTLLSGEVSLDRGGARHPLDARAPLLAGDRLTTGATGRVGLQWGEGSGALVAPSSDLVLARLAPTAQELRLDGGQVAVRVGPHQAGEGLSVVTPSHVVAVHGTWFVVAADARGTAVEVLEGVVEVSARAGDASSMRLAAPSRAFFPAGSAVPDGKRSLSAHEAAARRAASEMNLLPWIQAGAESADCFDGLAGTTGLLDVSTRPAASIAVDGVPFGAAPVELRRARGRHLVELSRPGFATISRWITVGPEPGELLVNLVAQRAPLPVVPPAPEEVRDMARARRRQISACYEHALKRDPRLAGTVTLALRIGGAGQVLSTRVDDDTLREPEIAGCLRREAAGWSFQRARNATVVYPFVFRAE